jgi:hypothetical protein
VHQVRNQRVIIAAPEHGDPVGSELRKRPVTQAGDGKVVLEEGIPRPLLPRKRNQKFESTSLQQRV